MSLSLQAAGAPMRRFGLAGRLAVAGAVLAVETLLMSYLIQGPVPASIAELAKAVQDIHHWLFRFVIAYAVSLAILVYLRGSGAMTTAMDGHAPVRPRWWLMHALLLIPFAFLSAALYKTAPALPFAIVAVAWHACGIAVVLTAFAGLAPWSIWIQVVRATGALPLYALAPAAAAVAAVTASELLWEPAAELTFRIVELLLRPLSPSLHGDFTTLTIATDHFAVVIAPVCSGLEGVGLMLIFCATWLLYFRREYYFPQALTIIPAAVLFIFFLNAVRIAMLILIGDAGYERIAMVGFHSQAGWIAFNLAALGVAVVAKRSAWLNRTARQPKVNAENATAAYLMPLLAILAAGMVAHALSAGFDLLYPLRLVCAAAVLWLYRRRYAVLDWGFSWRALAVGGALFVVWVGLARVLANTAAMPEVLAQLPSPVRAAWVACRVLAAVVTVPIAEELAYRGYLLRRLTSADFESIPLRQVRWPALVVGAAAFGVMHGSFWLPGILAGLAYGLLAVKTGKIGESVAAHATTNVLLAGYVLLFGQWQLW